MDIEEAIGHGFVEEDHASESGVEGYLEPDPLPPSVVVPIVKKQLFSFDGRASGADTTVVLGQSIPVTKWTSGALIVILHSKNTWSAAAGLTTAQLLVQPFAAFTDPDEPQTVFADTSRVIAPSTTILASTTAPQTYINSLIAPYGPEVLVRLRFRQLATPAVAAQTATLSVYLLGRLH